MYGTLLYHGKKSICNEKYRSNKMMTETKFTIVHFMCVYCIPCEALTIHSFIQCALVFLNLITLAAVNYIIR